MTPPSNSPAAKEPDHSGSFKYHARHCYPAQATWERPVLGIAASPSLALQASLSSSLCCNRQARRSPGAALTLQNFNRSLEQGLTVANVAVETNNSNICLAP